jgi:ABC-2 type transport system ATP-binding protein
MSHAGFGTCRVEGIMIDVEGLTKIYGPRMAVDDLSFHVGKGEIVGFLGPNGAGKTTTMRMLTGYLPPSDGHAAIAGFDTFKQSLDARRRIGYLPETVPLYPEMSVADYLDFMAALRKVSNRRAAVQRAMEASHVEDQAHVNIGKLSKGYRQRVGLAQAIVHDPDVLILDEPTIGLDPRQIIEVRELIKGLAGQHTILISTHILPEVEQVCSRVLIIHKGKLVAEDTPQNLGERLRHVERVGLQVTGDGAALTQALAAVPGVLEVRTIADKRYEVAVTPGQDIRAQLAATVVKGGWGLLELSRVGMSLEEIFLQLTQEETGELHESDTEAVA